MNVIDARIYIGTVVEFNICSNSFPDRLSSKGVGVVKKFVIERNSFSRSRRKRNKKEG